MVIDFSKFDAKARPTLVLRNLDGTAIQTLGYAFGVSGTFNYNETSTLTFSYPAHVDGKRVPGYDKIVGMRMVDALGIGRFILVNPGITESASREVKTVEAYSLEYEFTFKKLSLENGTYNFWNPAAPDDTILGIILERMPDWSVGSVDEGLIGKYRTFEVSNENLYNFMKGTLQESYSCIFDFDTYQRKVNVRDISASAAVRPVYISLDNLAKEIEIEEDTENIFTCLDVNGAEGVTIRNVNPMGVNKIYNLDYFMTEDNFSPALISKWEAWKTGFAGYQNEYFSRTVENALLHVELETEKAALTKLEGELKVLEEQQAVVVEAEAAGIDGDLPSYASQISDKRAEIRAKESEIAAIESEMEESQASLIAINKATAWSAYGITPSEEITLSRYIKEDAITDSTFVAPTVDSYKVEGDSYPNANVSIQVRGAVITGSTLSNGRLVYSARGGTVSVTVNGEVKLSGANVLSAFDYLSGNSTTSIYLESGCATLTGPASVSTDSTEDPDIGGNYIEGTQASITSTRADVYITKNLSAYQQRAVEWELFDYGAQILEDLAWPTYHFSVDSGNFLAMDDFDAFRRQLKLGDKLYLNLGETFGVLSPVLIGVEVDFESKDLELQFSDSFSLSDSAFKLADLLDQSVSMGKSVDFNKYNYNAFTNAGGTNAVRDLMDAMRDVALNGLFASSNQAFSIDGSGIHLRKWRDESQTDYEEEQIWMINNSIVFTDDNWNSVKVAIGKFVDENMGEMWGIVAPNLVGTLLAGENLMIQSTKQSGGVAVFQVDADGAKLYNSQFDLVGAAGQIGLHPEVGLAAGAGIAENALYAYDSSGNITGIKMTDGSSATNIDDIGSRTPVPCFWLDLYGNAYFKGTIYATDGVFSGDITGATGTFKGTVQAAAYLDANGNNMMDGGKWSSEYLDLYGITIRNRSTGGISFQVSETGAVTINGNITMGAGSSINWDSVTEIGQSEAYDLANSAQNRADEAYELANSIEPTELPDYIKSTYIDFSLVSSPKIQANDLEVYNDGFTLWGYVPAPAREYYEALRFSYSHGDYPVVHISSPSNMRIMFEGYVDFNEATVEGLTATFA